MNFSQYVKSLKEAKKKKPGLWANIHAKRKRGEKPAKPGDKDYPKTLKIDEKKTRCWKGYKPTPGVKAYSPGSCKKVDEKMEPAPEGNPAQKAAKKVSKNINRLARIKRRFNDPQSQLGPVRRAAGHIDKVRQNYSKGRDELEAAREKTPKTPNNPRNFDSPIYKVPGKQQKTQMGARHKQAKREKENPMAKKYVTNEASKSRLRRVIGSSTSDQLAKNRARIQLKNKLKDQEGRGMSTAENPSTDLNTATRAADGAIDAKKERETHEKFPPAKKRKVKTQFPPLPRPR
jgi:hypothetical protein